MALDKLSFTKDWNNPEDFPTYEPSESKVRSDMQQLHDETKDYLNKKVVPAVENVEEAVKNVNSANHTHGNLGVLNTITAVTQTLGNAADKVPSEAAVKKAISDFSTDAGLGDMSSATYDPQNKKTDVFKYADQAATAAKNAAVAAAKTEAENLIAAAAPNEHNHQGQSLNPLCIELAGANAYPDVNGGYIDFHYAASGEDYTSRIIEHEEGVLHAKFKGDSNYYELLHTGNMTKTGGIINRNLLHNWNFLDPINSRGQTEYVGSGYHIDRWRGGYSTDVTTITESGLKIENKRKDGNLTWARQYLEDYLDPGAYTLSVLVTAVEDAVVYMCTDGGAAVPRTLPLSVGLNTITADIGVGKVNRVQFTISGSVTVAAVKLERGKVQTLAEQDADGSWYLLGTPWDKGLETLRCVTSTADPADTYANKGSAGTQLAYGSYEGTGTYGDDAPNTVTLPFAADVFIMLTRTYVSTYGKPHVVALWGTDYICVLPLSSIGTEYPDNYDINLHMPTMFGNSSGAKYSIAKKSADGRTITWCHEGDEISQFNSSGSTYHWMAIKF